MAHVSISSFYGLLDILGSTNLDTNQRELGKEIIFPPFPVALTYLGSPNGPTILRVALENYRLHPRLFKVGRLLLLSTESYPPKQARSLRPQVGARAFPRGGRGCGLR